MVHVISGFCWLLLKELWQKKTGPFLDPHFLDPGKSHNLGVPDVPTVHKNPLVGAFGCFGGMAENLSLPYTSKHQT